MARRAKPIPLELLIHNIFYQEVGVSDGWNTSVGELTPINNVRIQAISRKDRAANSQGTSSQLDLMLDRTNSSQYFEFKVDSKIFYKDKEYTVVEVNPFYDFDPEPHHYEIGLI